MNVCEKCGFELFGAEGKQAETIIVNGNRSDVSTKLVLKQYLTCRNQQCGDEGKEVVHFVNLNFTEAESDVIPTIETSEIGN